MPICASRCSTGWTISGLSFVQRAEDVAEARNIAGGRAWIMTKLEKPQGAR